MCRFSPAELLHSGNCRPLGPKAAAHVGTEQQPQIGAVSLQRQASKGANLFVRTDALHSRTCRQRLDFQGNEEENGTPATLA